VLKPGGLVSTRTLFLHREERVETGGYEFNRQEAGGNSGRSEAKTGEVAALKRKKTLMGLRDRSATMDESKNFKLSGV
jgi:hypothetical protein